MKLVFLGTSGYHPTERRHTSCLLLPECGVVLDAGTGVFRLGRFLETETADIFLTHAHLDHSVGLTYLFSVLAEHPLERLTIHGEADKLQGIREHLFSKLLFPVIPPWEFRALDTSPDGRSIELPLSGRLTLLPLERLGSSARVAASGRTRLPSARTWTAPARVLRDEHGIQPQGIDPARREAARDCTTTAPERRHRRLQPAHGRALQSERPQAPFAAVPSRRASGTA
jgi:hypothetical protein